jgi:hypothetical protein
MPKFKLFLSVLFLGLMACNAETASYKEKPVAIQLKPHAPVYMTYKIVERIKVNKTFIVKVIFKSDIDADDLMVRFHANSALKFVSEKQYYFGIQSASKSNELSITILPQKEGEFYLNVSASLINNGEHQSRSFAIPIKIGEVQGKFKLHSPQSGTTINNGIISMPGVETTR